MASLILLCFGAASVPCSALITPILLARALHRWLSYGMTDIPLITFISVFKSASVVGMYAFLSLFSINQLFSEMTIGAHDVIITDAFRSIRIPWDTIEAYEETGNGSRVAWQILRLKEKIPRVNRRLLKIPLGWIRVDTVNVTQIGIEASEDLRAFSSKNIH